MFTSSLQRPDATAWHGAPFYSSKAAEALSQAYLSVARAHIDPDAYRAAYLLVTPYRTGVLCLQQRMHIEYILAQAYASEADFDDAAASIARALEIANVLGDRLSEVELHYLMGSVRDAQGRLSTARHHYAASLHILEDPGLVDGFSDDPLDPSFQLALLIRLAAMAFELGEYGDASQYLDDARTLQTCYLPDAHVEAASIAWL